MIGTSEVDSVLEARREGLTGLAGVNVEAIEIVATGMDGAVVVFWTGAGGR